MPYNTLETLLIFDAPLVSFTLAHLQLLDLLLIVLAKDVRLVSWG